MTVCDMEGVLLTSINNHFPRSGENLTFSHKLNNILLFKPWGCSFMTLGPFEREAPDIFSVCISDCLRKEGA